MTQVKGRESQMRLFVKDFFDIQMIQNQAAKRQLTFIGKVTRTSDEHLSKKLITEWYNNKQRVVGVIHSNKKSYCITFQ